VNPEKILEYSDPGFDGYKDLPGGKHQNRKNTPFVTQPLKLISIKTGRN
jgi:hypothetical protein